MRPNEPWPKKILKNTHKIDIWVVDRSLLQAEVENDDERMSQVAGEADVGQRSPETPRQEGVDKTCRNNGNEQRLTLFLHLLIKV